MSLGTIEVPDLSPQTMRFGVVVFPGSNCDHDAWYAASANLGQQAEFLWHDERSLRQVDAVILPGGFSYGDYLRCGAIAKFSPVMQSVKDFAQSGGLVAGFCNGFQILVESGLLPGALLRNASMKFVCGQPMVSVETVNSPFTCAAKIGQRLQLPVAHGEGNYTADERTLDRLEAEDRIVVRYTAGVNGSARNIAGILSAERNVMGMMPHPERACDPLMGSVDGRVIFESILTTLATPARSAA